MKYTILLFSLLSHVLLAQDNVPTQSQLAKRHLWTFLKDMPKNFLQCTPHFLKMGTFQLLKNEAPVAFSLLKVNDAKRIPSAEHNFPFTNSSGFESIVDVQFGLCMGHTTALRKFNMISFYDKKNAAGFLIPNKELHPENWYNFYQKKIDMIMNNEPTVFPGFENLLELSSEPRLQDYIKKHIVESWAENNVSFGGAKILASVNNKFVREESLALHADISKKLAMNFNPRLYFAGESEKVFSDKQWIHAMQVYKVDPIAADGSYIMYVWDINNAGAAGSVAVPVSAEGVITYNGHTMAEVSFVPWDEFEVGEMLGNLIPFCLKNPSFCK